MDSTPTPAGKRPDNRRGAAAKPVKPATPAKPAIQPKASVPARPATAPAPSAAPRPSSLTREQIAAVRAASPSTRTVAKPPVELWKCNECSAALDKGCVAAGMADIVDGQLLCTACLGRRKAEARRVQLKRLLSVGGAVLAVAATVGIVLMQQSSKHHQQQEQIEQLATSAEKVSELLTRDQCLQALRQVKALEDKAARLDDAAAQRARAMIDESKQKIDGWFQRTYGNLEPAEKKILISLLGTYCSDPERPLQILSLHLEHGKLDLKVIGSMPVKTLRAPELENAPRPDVAITADTRPLNAMDEARVFLVSVFNSFAEVSLVELQWFVRGKDEPEEFGTFVANRRQLSRLEQPQLDLNRLNER